MPMRIDRSTRLLALRAALAVLCVCAILFTASGCGDGTKAEPGGGKGSRAYRVKTASVEVRQVNYEIETTGTVEAQDVYRVDAQVAGVVEGVAFNEGDEVSPAGVLCRVSPATYQLAVTRAQAALLKAKADLADGQRFVTNAVSTAEVNVKEAQAEVDRRKALREAGAIADEEVYLYEIRLNRAQIALKDARERAETQVKVLSAAVTEQDAELKLAEENLRKSAIAAPIEGVIEQRLVTNGSHVSPGEPIARLVDRRSWKLRFSLPESKAPHVTVGSAVNFQLEAYPGQKLAATVYRVGDLSDARTRELVCWAKVAPTELQLKAGIFAVVTIVSGSKAKAVVVPVTAALPTEHGFVAYVIEDGKAIRRSLRLGLHVTGELVEVLDGLDEGERVVVEGSNALQEGVPVQEQESKSGTRDAPGVSKPAAGPAGTKTAPELESAGRS